MFEITMKTESDSLKSKLYDVIHEVMKEVVEDKKIENELPFLISKNQMAKSIFGVSPQTLDAHVICRPDFPKLKVGERILFPRDQVLDWIRSNAAATLRVNLKLVNERVVKNA